MGNTQKIHAYTLHRYRSCMMKTLVFSVTFCHSFIITHTGKQETLRWSLITVNCFPSMKYLPIIYRFHYSISFFLQKNVTVHFLGMYGNEKQQVFPLGCSFRKKYYKITKSEASVYTIKGIFSSIVWTDTLIKPYLYFTSNVCINSFTELKGLFL